MNLVGCLFEPPFLSIGKLCSIELVSVEQWMDGPVLLNTTWK